MSPAQKSKAKSLIRMAKEQQKTSLSSLTPSISGNVPATACSPSSHTSHASETPPQAPSLNAGFLMRVEVEEQNQSLPRNGSECDSTSNNGSCSGESEDPKDKAPASNALQSEAIPGCDTDKRDKVRQKNERKHQRQKEKRAQELQERCTNILMSRKLDMLAQQLVVMGFPAERATRALILNDGRVEDSVSWLLEGGMEGEQFHATKKDGPASVKIDISNELAKMTEMEAMFKCSKQEVQRAVVSNEGDLKKVTETLKTQQKQDIPSTPPRLTLSSAPNPANGTSRVAQPSQVMAPSLQAKLNVSVAAQQSKREERDLNHLKAGVAMPSSYDLRNADLQPSSKALSKSDWVKNQGAMLVDKRWASATSGPLFSHSLVSSSLQTVALPAKAENNRHVVVANERGRLGLQLGSTREPIVLMQRPQAMNAKHYQPSTSTSLSMPALPATTGWESSRSSLTGALKVTNGGLGQRYPSISQSTSSVLNPNSQPFLHPEHARRPFVSSPLEVDPIRWGSGSSSSGRGYGQPSSLASSSSLGIFTGWGSSSGSSGSSSPVDWSNGNLIPQFDYTRVDWSLESTPLAFDDSQSPASNRLYEAWLTQFEAPTIRNSLLAHHGDHRIARFLDNNSLLSVDPISTVLSPDWTSPFAGKDIFRVPRQIVTSPSP